MDSITAIDAVIIELLGCMELPFGEMLKRFPKIINQLRLVQQWLRECRS